MGTIKEGWLSLINEYTAIDLSPGYCIDNQIVTLIVLER